jgi:hypothetical protein
MTLVEYSEMGDKQSQQRRRRADGAVRSVADRSAVEENRALAPQTAQTRNPTLFEMDKLELTGNLVNSLNVERPYSEPGLLLGTSSFTANGGVLPSRHEAQRPPVLLRETIQDR